MATSSGTSRASFAASLRLRSHLLSRLLAISHRTYLWVYLVFDFLEKADFRRTEGGLSEVLATLPNSVTDAYEKILSRSNDACFVMRALSIIIAARKPLTLAQINVAFHIHDGYTSDLDLDLEDDDDFGLRLRTCCGLFLSVNQGRVYLLHQTAREFLLGPTRLSQTSMQWQGSIVIEDAEAILAQSCVLRLRVLDPQTFVTETVGLPTAIWRLEDSLRDGPDFLSYTIDHWDKHVRLAQSSNKFSSLMTAMGIRDLSSETYWRLSLFTLAGFKGAYCEAIYKAPECQLHLAAGCGHQKLVEWHIDNGAHIDACPDDTFPPPLCEAVDNYRQDVVLFLLARGAKVDAVAPSSPLKQPATFSATWHSSDQTLAALLRYGADVNYTDSLGRTPLFRAISASTAKILIDAGARVNVADSSGRTPLLMAVGRENEPVLEVLIQHDADTSARTKLHQTPLSEAARLAWWRGIEVLLLAGADMNTMMPNGNQTIWAFIAEAIAPVASFDKPMPLSPGLLRMIQSKLGAFNAPVSTPLHIATLYNHHSCMLELLSDGAYVDARDQAQLTPLMIAAAAKFPDTDSLELLLRAGADPNASNSKFTALHAAVHREWDAAVRVLLAAGADPNTRDEETGSNAMHIAAAYGYSSIVEILLAAGADVGLPNREGKTAMQLAHDADEDQIAAILRQTGLPSNIGHLADN